MNGDMDTFLGLMLFALAYGIWDGATGELWDTSGQSLWAWILHRLLALVAGTTLGVILGAFAAFIALIVWSVVQSG